MPHPKLLPQADRRQYTRLHEVIHRRRAYHFCVISYLLGWIVLWITMLDGLPAFWNGLHVTMWIMAAANWASATIPLMALRKIQRTALTLHAPTRYTRFWAALRSTQFITSFIFCLISSTSIGVTYILAATALNQNPELNLLKKIPGRGVAQLNERPIYLLVSSWYTALCYSLFAVYHGRWQYHPLDVSDNLTIPERIWRSFGSRIRSIRRAVMIFSATYIPLYWLLRGYVTRAIIFSKYTQLTKYIKPHMIMLIKFDSIITLTSTIRLVMLNTLAITMWEIVQVLWDVYSTHPLDLSRFDTEPNTCLLEGIKSTDPRIKHHAMRELAHVSWSDPARRTTIFEDIRTSPKLLNLIIDESLDLIQTTRLTIESRGQLIQTIPASSSVHTSTDPRKISSGGHSALKNDLPQLFQNPSSGSNSLKQVLLTKLLSSDQDKSSPNPSQSSSPLSLNTGQRVDYQIPQIFQRDPVQKATPNKTATTANPQPDKSPLSTPSSGPSAATGQRRQKIVPKIWKVLLDCKPLQQSNVGIRLEEWLFAPLIEDELEKSLANRQLCSFAVEVVTNFTCASLTEDQYGVLQDQIPRIIETLVDAFEALDRLRTDICAEFGISSPALRVDSPSGASAIPDPQQTRLHQALDKFLHPLLTRLKTAIFGITDQFRPFLNEMKLSPKILHWLEAHPR